MKSLIAALVILGVSALAKPASAEWERRDYRYQQEEWRRHQYEPRRDCGYWRWSHREQRQVWESRPCRQRGYEDYYRNNY